MARNRGGDSFVAHTESAVAPVKSSTICNYVAPRFRENATPESIISTICAPHSGRNCRTSVKGRTRPGIESFSRIFSYCPDGLLESDSKLNWPVPAVELEA